MSVSPALLQATTSAGTAEVAGSPQLVGQSLSTTAIRDGQVVTLGYQIDSPGAMDIRLDAHLVGPGGEVATDPAAARVETVWAEAGTHWYYRNFLVNLPPEAPLGQYDVVWTLHTEGFGDVVQVQNDGVTLDAPVPIRVPVLLYHHVSPNPGNSISDALPTAEFRAQMQALAAYGYTSITLNELMSYRAGVKAPPERPILICFDDGWESLHTDVFPALSETGMKVNAFIATRNVNDVPNDGTVDPDTTFLSWSEIQELQDSGLVEFQSHTITHPDLTILTSVELAAELTQSKQTLEEKIGREVHFIGYPYGAYDATVQAAAREAGYFGGLTAWGGVETDSLDKWALRRITTDRYTSAEYDPAHPERFLFNVIGDPCALVGESISTGTASDGQTLALSYQIACASDTLVTLEATLTAPSGQTIGDPRNTVTIAAAAGTHTYSRDFRINLPPQAETGPYDVNWTLRTADGKIDTATQESVLTVVAPTPVRASILMYHHVNQAPNDADQVTPQMLRDQWQAMKDQGYTFVTLGDLMDYRAGVKAAPAKPVAMIFDDGWASLYTDVLPILSQLDAKATVFVVSGNVNEEDPSPELDPDLQILSWNQVRLLADSGRVDIQSHTVSHADLAQLDPAALASELVNSKAALEAQLNRKVDFIGYPYGSYTDAVQQAAWEAGYFGGVTAWGGVEMTSEDKWAWQRVDIDWNTTTVYDPAHPEDYLFFKLEDADVMMRAQAAAAATQPTAGDDVIRIVRSGSQVDVFVNNPGSVPTFSAPADELVPWTIRGAEGDDRLIIDLSGGNPLPAGGLVYDGGPHDAGNQLVILGTQGNENVQVSDRFVSLIDGASIGYANVQGFTFDSAGAFTVQNGTIDATLTGRAGLTKETPGTVTLGGTKNSYEGGTVVTAGTLVIGSAGALPSGRSLSIGSGGTLVLGGGLAMPASALAPAVTQDSVGKTAIQAPSQSVGKKPLAKAAVPWLLRAAFNSASDTAKHARAHDAVLASALLQWTTRRKGDGRA